MTERERRHWMMCGRMFMGRDGSAHVCNIGKGHGCGCTWIGRAGESVAEEGTLDMPFMPISIQRRERQLAVAEERRRKVAGA